MTSSNIDLPEDLTYKRVSPNYLLIGVICGKQKRLTFLQAVSKKSI